MAAAAIRGWILPSSVGRSYYQMEGWLISNTLPTGGQLDSASFVTCAQMLLNGSKKVKVLRPQPYSNSDADREALQRELASATHYLAVPIIFITSWRSRLLKHVTLLLFEKGQDGSVRSIEFFDSRGSSLEDHPAVRALVETIRPPNCRLIETKKAMQSWVDCINCGAFVLHRIDQAARLAEGQKPSEDIGSLGAVYRRWRWADRLAHDLAVPKEPDEWGDYVLVPTPESK